MDKVQIAPFHISHLDLMNIREHELNVFGRDYLAQMADLGQCITLVIDGVVIAVLGYFALRPGVIEVWLIPSRYVNRQSFLFLRWARRYADAFARNLEVHRMQTTSRADGETDRWMKYLGFQYEGTLIEYTQDREDYRMWARIT